MYALRFKEEPPARRSVDQLRGIEGARVKRLYETLAKKYRVPWKSRRYDPADWSDADTPNRCLSASTACLYGVTEAAVLAAGYAPAIGFLHAGRPQSFVYDIADIFKFDTVVPIAFRVAGLALKPDGRGRDGVAAARDPEGAVRRACRDNFRETGLLSRLIPTMEEVLAAGGLEPPKEAPAAAAAEAEPIVDDGGGG